MNNEKIIEFLKTIKYKKEMKELFDSEKNLIIQKLHDQGWEKTFEFVKCKRNQYAGESELSRQIKGFYHNLYCKMWKLNKNDKKNKM